MRKWAFAIFPPGLEGFVGVRQENRGINLLETFIVQPVEDNQRMIEDGWNMITDNCTIEPGFSYIVLCSEEI